MRAFAITGMETTSWMPEIISGSLILATPPSARMSAGTRSSAITATAPLSSAIFASPARTPPPLTPPRALVLGDLRLLGVHHVHDDPALEHLGHPALDPERPGLPPVFRHRFCPRECLLESVKRILLPASPEAKPDRTRAG